MGRKFCPFVETKNTSSKALRMALMHLTNPGNADDIRPYTGYAHFRKSIAAAFLLLQCAYQQTLRVRQWSGQYLTHSNTVSQESD